MINPDVIRAEIAALLHAYPELRQDEEALLLSLESETSAIEQCESFVKRIKELEAHANSCVDYVKELKARQDLLELRAERMRAALIRILETAGIKSLPLSIATLSVRYVPHVNIVERDLVPEQYRRYPQWEPQKQLIGTALKAGQHVPGCTLSNPSPTLTIRTK